jgi:hypothetical protein
MGFHASSCLTAETDSKRAGHYVGKNLREAFTDHRLSVVIIYATINHDQDALLAAIRDEVGPGVIITGCSAQGVIGHGVILEGGFGVGAMGLGGESLKAAVAFQPSIESDGVNKGRALATSLKSQLGAAPNLLFFLYDTLCGSDVNQLLAGIRQELPVPVIGGAAGQPTGPVATTYQYHDGKSYTRAAVALGLIGPFNTEFGVSHGTTPTGIVMTLTKADGNRVLELDGRPALDVWRETTGLREDEPLHQDHTAALAMGVERTIIKNGHQQSTYLIRAVFGLDPVTKAIIVPAAIAEGSKLQFHHRTARVVKEGSLAMGRDLHARLGDKRPWAVLGFECGARTAPFLGLADTLEENKALQDMVAASSPWLTIIPWGEIAPYGDDAAFCNYTYTLAALTQ